MSVTGSDRELAKELFANMKEGSYQQTVSWLADRLARYREQEVARARLDALEKAAQAVTDLCHQNESERDGNLIEAAMYIRRIAELERAAQGTGGGT